MKKIIIENFSTLDEEKFMPIDNIDLLNLDVQQNYAKLQIDDFIIVVPDSILLSNNNNTQGRFKPLSTNDMCLVEVPHLKKKYIQCKFIEWVKRQGGSYGMFNITEFEETHSIIKINGDTWIYPNSKIYVHY